MGIPGISSVSTELQSKDSFELGDFLMCQQFCIVHAEVRVVIGVHVGAAILEGSLLDLSIGLADA